MRTHAGAGNTWSQLNWSVEDDATNNTTMNPVQMNSAALAVKHDNWARNMGTSAGIGVASHVRSLSVVESWTSKTDGAGDACADSAVERIDLSDRALAIDEGAATARLTGSSSDSTEADGRSAATFAAILRC